MSPNRVVNDYHSQLNETEVAEVAVIHCEHDIITAIHHAREKGYPICIAGGRGAMGGQQFCAGALLLDTLGYNSLLHLDTKTGRVTCESGIVWPELLQKLDALQGNVAPDQQWTILQKQTGADYFTLGGSVSANAHGRILTHGPLGEDVCSLRVVMSDGTIKTCSRSEESELFSLVIGGYGLFGVISTVELQLVKRTVVQRHVTWEHVSHMPSLLEKMASTGYSYGDFQFSCDENSPTFLTEGIMSCYKPVIAVHDEQSGRNELSEEDWRGLLVLGHVQKSEAIRRYRDFYLSTHGQTYWHDTAQLSTYLKGYHEFVDVAMNAPHKCSEMITECNVPRSCLTAFMEEVRLFFKRENVNVIYGTVRLITADKTSFLPWAKQDLACVIFNLHTEHTTERLSHTKEQFRHLIDITQQYGGTFYLTYHRWASKDQILKTYAEFPEFLRKKRQFDENELFQSSWYRHFKDMFAEDLKQTT